MFALRLFGTVSLDIGGEAVHGRATQRRRLALLALLAAAPDHCLARDKILAWLWPEHDQEQARHLLSVSLYELRKVLGEKTLVSRGEDVALATAGLSVDVIDFDEALRRGELERAVELYAGPFLDGFHVSDAPDFERWVDAAQEEYRRRYREALESLAEERARGGDLAGATEALRRLVVDDPYSARYTLRYMEALEQAGDRAAALQHARVHAALLKADFDAEPDLAVTELAERIRTSPQQEDGPAVPDAVEPAGTLDVPASPGPEPPPAAPEPVAVGAATPQDTTSARPAGRRAPVRADRGRAPRPVRAVVFGAILLLALAAGLAMPRWWTGRDQGAVTVPGASIAVLPFEPIPPATQDDEYFRDGLTDEIITALGRVEGLRVISRTSTFQLKGQDLDVREVGERFGVATVLEGSVRRDADAFRIAVNLVSSADRAVLWSQTYTAPFADLFQVQEEIARRIVEALRGRLTGREAAVLAARSTGDLDAYNHYLQGVYHWHTRTPEGLIRARMHFEQALAIDPGYSLAFAGLSDVYNTLGSFEYGLLPPSEAYPAAEQAAREAVRLDPGNAKAHAALGNVLLNHRRDPAAAAESFRTALVLNPGYSDARHWYSLALVTMGRWEEALTQIRRARELEPRSPTLSTSLGRHHYFARDFDEAIREFRRALELDPEFHVASVALGMAMLQDGQAEGAIEVFRRVAEALDGRYLLANALLGHALAAAGQDHAAGEILEELDAHAANRFVPPEYATIVHLGLGNHAKALDGLEHAHRIGSGSMIYLEVEPLLDPLRGDPRFLGLIQEVRAQPVRRAPVRARG